MLGITALDLVDFSQRLWAKWGGIVISQEMAASMLNLLHVATAHNHCANEQSSLRG